MLDDRDELAELRRLLDEALSKADFLGLPVVAAHISTAIESLRFGEKPRSED